MVNADLLHSKLNTETIKKHGIIVENTESILKYKNNYDKNINIYKCKKT